MSEHTGTIDPSTLATEYLAGEPLCSDPPIWLFNDFASSDETKALKQAAREKLTPAKVSGKTEGYLSDGRTGSNCWIPHNHNEYTLQLAAKISKLAGIPLSHAENFQVVHYSQGQQYKAHFDAWDADTERGQRCMAQYGQRLVTALIYLSYVESGGATSFPKLELDVAPVSGSMLLFHNCLKGTSMKHKHSLHGGLPVTQGEKWAANLWFREKPLRP